jgi:lipoyl(octanoyl) transferase
MGPQQLGTFEALDLAAPDLEMLALLPEAKESEEELQQRRRLVILENWIVVDNKSNQSATPQRVTVPFDAAWKRQQDYWQEHADRLLMQQQKQQQQQQQGRQQKQQQQQGRQNSQGLAPEEDDGSVSSFYRPPIHDIDGGQPPAEVSAKGVDRVIFLQHEPVYTLGTGSDPSYILNSNSSVPVVRMDRGGEVTYHGPGQLVAYPVLDLRGYRQDIHWYMRALEEAVIVALHDMGLDRAGRDADTTGVWIDNHKVAAMGVKCRKWVTMHGLAVNVEPTSLKGFDGIVPCGLHGRKVGCVSHFAGRHVTVAEFADRLKRAMEKVFQIQFVEIHPPPPSD